MIRYDMIKGVQRALRSLRYASLIYRAEP